MHNAVVFTVKCGFVKFAGASDALSKISCFQTVKIKRQQLTFKSLQCFVPRFLFFFCCCFFYVMPFIWRSTSSHCPGTLPKHPELSLINHLDLTWSNLFVASWPKLLRVHLCPVCHRIVLCSRARWKSTTVARMPVSARLWLPSLIWMATASTTWWWERRWRTTTEEPFMFSLASRTGSCASTNRYLHFRGSFMGNWIWVSR